MKTMITALVALATTISASASHIHTAACNAKCSEIALSVTPVSKSYDQQMAELKLAAEDRLSELNYRNAMQRTLNEISRQKHADAIENLEAENAFNNLMSNMLGNLEQEKLEDSIEDLTASRRFEELMGKVLTNTGSR